jgi:hypothetical protein
MAQNAISAHGTLLYHNGVEVGELGDFTLPGLMRNEFDATTHNIDIDIWVMGVLRREPVTFPVFFNSVEATHLALRQSIIDNTEDEFKIVFPDGDEWLGSGFVRQVSQAAPVDGILSANVTIRLSGAMLINGVGVGV